MATRRRLTQLVFAVGLIAWTTNAAMIWADAAPLGHDEAQYALAAKHRLDGELLRWNYLSEGMNAIAVPGVVAGGSERALRLLPAAISIAFVLAAAQLARRAVGGASAAWVVLVMAITSSMARRSVELADPAIAPAPISASNASPALSRG